MATRANHMKTNRLNKQNKIGKTKVELRAQNVSPDFGSQDHKGNNLSKLGRGSASTRIAAKGKVKKNLHEESSQESSDDQLAMKVYEREQIFENEIKDIDQQTTDKLLEVEKLFKGAGSNSLSGGDFDNIEVRLDRFIKRAQTGNYSNVILL
jgi:hypothetical protein